MCVTMCLGTVYAKHVSKPYAQYLRMEHTVCVCAIHLINTKMENRKYLNLCVDFKLTNLSIDNEISNKKCTNSNAIAAWHSSIELLITRRLQRCIQFLCEIGTRERGSFH